MVEQSVISLLLYQDSKKRLRALERGVLRNLLQIHAATELRVLASPPGNQFEALGGDRKAAFHSNQ